MTARQDKDPRQNWTSRLAETFPVVKGLIGSPAFLDLAERFVAAQERASPPLETFGADFPAFLEEKGATRDIPYLADMARLEWTHYEAAIAPESEALPSGGFTAVAPEALTYVSVTFHPATRLLTTAYPVYGLWQRRAAGSGDAPLLTRHGEVLLFTRKNHAVRVHKLPQGAGLTLQGLGEGLRLGTAYERAFARHADFDLKALLAMCLEQGAFSAMSLDRCPTFASDGVKLKPE